MAVNSVDFAQPAILTGGFTSACPTADVTETLGFAPNMVIVFNPDGTNIDISIASSEQTVYSILLTGSTGVTTEVAVATGLDITANGFICRSERQTQSEVNHWIAFR